MCLYAYREGSLAESLLHSLVLELRRFPIFHRRNSRLSLEKPRTPPPSNGRGARPTNRPTSSSSSSSTNHPGSEYRHIWTKSNVSYLNVSTYLPTPLPLVLALPLVEAVYAGLFFFFPFFFPPNRRGLLLLGYRVSLGFSLFSFSPGEGEGDRADFSGFACSLACWGGWTGKHIFDR